MIVKRFWRAPTLAAVAVAGLMAMAMAAEAQSFDRLQTARTPNAPALSCKADKMFSCGASGCEVEDHPTGLPVEFELKTAEGKGYLCTYTYCRSFTLMGWRGRPQATGLTWSSQSGSTPPADKKPIYDFSLTIAEDWRSFSLASVGNGMVSGFTGSCSSPQAR